MRGTGEWISIFGKRYDYKSFLSPYPFVLCWFGPCRTSRLVSTSHLRPLLASLVRNAFGQTADHSLCLVVSHCRKQGPAI